jgi:hypothetical protein
MPTPTSAVLAPTPTQEPELIAITQEECLARFGNCSACSDWAFSGNITYYIRNRPAPPPLECGDRGYRVPMMTNDPWVWTPCFEQSIEGLASCADAAEYTLSVYFDPDFDWVKCRPMTEAEIQEREAKYQEWKQEYGVGNETE